MSHGSGEEENYWPGYVDALTSMVQVLAFVMMLLALAVYVLSQNVSRSVVMSISKAVEIKPDANATVEQILGDALAEIARLKALAQKKDSEGAAPSAAKDGGGSVAHETVAAPAGPSIHEAETAGRSALAQTAGLDAGAELASPTPQVDDRSRDRAANSGADSASREAKAASPVSGPTAAQAEGSGAGAAKLGESGVLPKLGARDRGEAETPAAAKAEAPAAEIQAAEGGAAISAMSRPLLMRRPDPGPASGSAFLLHFSAHGFQLEPSMKADLEKFLSENHAETAASLEVRAFAGADSGALTEARRLAYYRAMTIRKALADQKILLARIHVFLIDTPEKSLDSAAEISIGRAGAN